MKNQIPSGSAEAVNPTAGTLYLVSTPIGNLEDITLRALRILKSVDLIVAEDTRRTQKLLNHYQITRPLTSYYKDNEYRKTQTLIRHLLNGRSLAVVTDAGTPGISDPGVLLVNQARAAHISLEVIPGPSALLAALTSAGFSTEAFTFQGFPDAKASRRRKAFEQIKLRFETQIFFIAPHRLLETLQDFWSVWGDRQAVLCREMTKLHEEFIFGKISELVQRFTQAEPRGEFTLVVEGAQEILQPDTEDLETQVMRFQQEKGLTLNQAIAKVARERRIPREKVYALAHGKRKE